MRCLRRKGMSIPGTESDTSRRIEIDVDVSTALQDPEQRPPACGHDMSPAKPWRQRLSIERTRSPNDYEVARKLRTITQRAVQLAADTLAPLDVVEHPCPVVKRRSVADVLAMQARQLGDPVAHVILAEGGDPSTHRRNSGARDEAGPTGPKSPHHSVLRRQGERADAVADR